MTAAASERCDATAKRSGHSPPPLVVIDHTAFPCIMDSIISHTGWDGWVVLRQTSRAFRDRMDALLCHHVVLQDRLYGPEDAVFYRPGTIKQQQQLVPCLCLERPCIGRSLSLVGQHTRIVDDRTMFAVGVQNNKNLSHNELFSGVRVLRFEPHCGACLQDFDAPKIVNWRHFPSTHTIDDLRYPQNKYPYADTARHLVFHVDYEASSAFILRFPFIDDWDGLEEVVVVYTKKPKPPPPPHQGGYPVLTTRRPTGRAGPDAELGFIMHTLGMEREQERPIPDNVTLTLVGLEDLLDTNGLATRAEKDNKTHPHDVIRARIQRRFNLYSYYTPRVRKLLGEINFMSHEDYIRKIGRDEYELETREFTQASPLAGATE
ncbi:uncharacterized protein EHS24_006417 [Apiotrichum porosum]|uniref:Uncharacterized protein n=1 Tax=Apiotrichum porosum TaxID=105984 RepID=A0A427Y1C3_9TREE|nr:uncharacterized protein EHS24_006417 [Apiotrichum porosum]RSH84881.1 hypothetical protein EHS24_006417 [Apiotrichum porosum]